MNKKYYDVNSKEEYTAYTKKQIEMWKIKSGKQRNPLEYASVSCLLETEIFKNSSSTELICLGARNNWERDALKYFMIQSGVANLKAYSLDISPQSEVDYHYDFGKLPESWTGRFDIVYTNAADHSFNFDICLEEWRRIIKPEGVLILGISDQDIADKEIKGKKSTHEGDPTPNSHACTVFDVKSVDEACSKYFKRTVFFHRNAYQINANNETHSHYLNYNYWFNYGK